MSKRPADAAADAICGTAATVADHRASAPVTDTAAPNKRQKIEAEAKAGGPDADGGAADATAIAAEAQRWSDDGDADDSADDSDDDIIGLSADDAAAVDALLNRFVERLRRAEEADAVRGVRPKPKSDAARAGLQFGVERVHRELQHASGCAFVDRTAAVYLAAALEYVTAELLELAGQRAYAAHGVSLLLLSNGEHEPSASDWRGGDESCASWRRERTRTATAWYDGVGDSAIIEAPDLWYALATDDAGAAAQAVRAAQRRDGSVAAAATAAADAAAAAAADAADGPGGLGTLLDRLATDAAAYGHDGRGFAAVDAAAAGPTPTARPVAAAAAARAVAHDDGGVVKVWADLTPAQAQERFPVCLYGTSGAHALEVWREYTAAAPPADGKHGGAAGLSATHATADPSDSLPPVVQPIRSLAEAARRYGPPPAAGAKTAAADDSDNGLGERYAELYPLHAAVLLGDRPAFDHLMRVLQRSDQLTLARDRDDRNGLRPLHLAVRRGDVHMTRALMQSVGTGAGGLAAAATADRPYGSPYRDPDLRPDESDADDDFTLYRRPYDDAVMQFDGPGSAGDALLRALREAGSETLKAEELPLYSPLRVRMSAGVLLQSLPFVPKPIAALMAAYAVEWPAAFHTVGPAAAGTALTAVALSAAGSSAARQLAFAAHSELLQTATAVGFDPKTMPRQSHLQALSALLRAHIGSGTGHGVMIGDGGGDGTGTVRRFALLHVTSPSVRGTLWRGLCDAPEVRVAKRLVLTEIVPVMGQISERIARLARALTLPFGFGHGVDDSYVTTNLRPAVLWRWAKLQRQQPQQLARAQPAAVVRSAAPAIAAAAAASAATEHQPERGAAKRAAGGDADRVERCVKRVNALLLPLAVLRVSVGVVGTLRSDVATAAAPAAATASDTGNSGSGYRYEIVLVRRDGYATPIKLECSAYSQMTAVEVASSVVLRVPLRVAVPNTDASAGAGAGSQQWRWSYADADVAAHATLFARVHRVPAPAGVEVGDDESWDALQFRAVNAAEQSTADALCVFFKAARARLWHVPLRTDRGWARAPEHDRDPRVAPPELVDDTPRVRRSGGGAGAHAPGGDDDDDTPGGGGVGAPLKSAYDSERADDSEDDDYGSVVGAADVAAVNAEATSMVAESD